MLRINQQKSAAGAAKYFDEGLAREDYYTKDEILGRWGGRAAAKLELVGDVSREAFLALCDNVNPNDGKHLTQRTREGRTVCYDFNFHCPKSLSVLYGLTGDQRLLDAFRNSVTETMKEIETEAKTRVRNSGQDSDRVTGNLLWAEFVHLTSRPVGGIPDPHLHAHCVVMNATFDGIEQKWKAAQFRDLMRDAPYFEAAFHARLSRAVADLGLGVERTAKGWEVAGISRSVVEQFSRRTALIEELAKEKGITSPEEKASLGAKSREKKGEGEAVTELRSEWRRRLGDSERQELRDVLTKKVPSKQQSVSARGAVDHALSDGFERASVVSEKRLLAVALKRGYGSAKIDEVKHEFETREGVIRKQFDDQRFVTTKEVLHEEAEALAFARDGRGSCTRLARKDETHDLTGLNPQQQAAVRHVLHSTDRVMLIRGAAGTGKTTLLRTANSVIEEQGFRVHVFAPTAEASRGVLRKEGFAEAETVARLLVDEKLQSRMKGQVIWIDEAGLLGMRDLGKIFEVAEKQKARVVLVGDSQQHSSVARGDSFRLLQDHAGLRAAVVSDIRRQQGEYRKAVESLSRGDLESGFRRLDQLGSIREVADDVRHQVLARDYLEAAKTGKTVLVVSPTHAEGRRVTEAIRSELRGAGILTPQERSFTALDSLGMTEAMRADGVNYREGDVVQFHQNAKGGFRKSERLEVIGHDAEGQVLVQPEKGKPKVLPLDQAKHFEVYERRELLIAVGDRIRICQNGTTEGKKGRLNNGSLYSVTGFDRRGNFVVDSGAVISKTYGHLDYGYTTTSHASQGKTVDRVLVALGTESFGAASTEQFYVSVSRGRESATVYCSDKEAVLEAVSRSSHRISATELLTSEQKPIAYRDRTLLRGEHIRRTKKAEMGRGDRDSRDSIDRTDRVQKPLRWEGHER